MPRLLEFHSDEIQRLEHRAVGDDEQIRIAVERLVLGPGPVRDGEHVVLAPLDRLVADGRAAFARDAEHDLVVGGAAGAGGCLRGKTLGVAVERGHHRAA